MGHEQQLLPNNLPENHILETEKKGGGGGINIHLL
jgi:hypothetical protein